MSNATKKYLKLSVVFYILSTVCFIAPLAVTAIMAYASHPSELQLRILIGFTVSAVIFFIIDLFRRGHFRATAWLMLTAIIVVCNMDLVQWCVYVTTGCVILDEFVFLPLRRHFLLKVKINREIDKRG